MSHEKFSVSSAKSKEISNIRFSIIDNEEIVNNSVVEINTTDVYEKNYPKEGGVYDLRMGTIDKQYKCQTCNCDILNCHGHFGHIKLVSPVYNISYLTYHIS